MRVAAAMVVVQVTVHDVGDGIDRGALADAGIEEYDAFRVDDHVTQTRQYMRSLVGVRRARHDDVPEVDAANGDLAHPASLPHRFAIHRNVLRTAPCHGVLAASIWSKSP